MYFIVCTIADIGETAGHFSLSPHFLLLKTNWLIGWKN